MPGLTVHEFDTLVAASRTRSAPGDAVTVPAATFAWLEEQALRLSSVEGASWLTLGQRGGRRTVRLSNFVGVINAPGGFQLEVLPKIGKRSDTISVRQLLIDMLRSLGEFEHLRVDRARLAATRMPLLEVFIGEFLRSVEHVMKRGLKHAYNLQRDNIPALRGKLLMADHLRDNLFRRDRFHAEFDEFTPDCPENRLLHAGCRRTLSYTFSPDNQQLGRQLLARFAGVPESSNPTLDFTLLGRDRSTSHYAAALAWARLILAGKSPLTGPGGHDSESMLFPMEKVFEAFVAKHLPQQLQPGLRLSTQVQDRHLVEHSKGKRFRLRPDLTISDDHGIRLVLDTKWKLLDDSESSYGLRQADFYQLFAYGHNYLGGHGDLALVYPRTDSFGEPLPVFGFPASPGLRLWVLPFDLAERRIITPKCGSLDYALGSSR